jgi:membrane-associated protease RseP (regulator of RpoE activity)
MSESIQAIPPFVDAPAQVAGKARRGAARPTAGEWARHGALLALTAMTATLAGIMLVGPEPQTGALGLREPAHVLDYLLYAPAYYVALVFFYLRLAFAQPAVLVQGATFAVSLLAILTAHESGHYIACRRYGVDATLPFFIPAPPLFLAGTFGAFIKIKSPIPSRRALFDIGLAGPLAGFIVALPVAVAGVLTLKPAPPPGAEYAIIFNDPLLFRLIARLFGVALMENAPLNPFYMAAWIGLLVTSLNLMPVGQLDGGHATYAVFGPRAHAWLGRVAFVTVALLSVLGLLWYGSPSGFLYAVLLAVMLRMRHPQTNRAEPLGMARIVVAVITLAVFLLSFLPFPIKVM